MRPVLGLLTVLGIATLGCASEEPTSRIGLTALEGTINACVSQSNGAMRVIDRSAGQECGKGEVAVALEQRSATTTPVTVVGPEGPQGPIGPAGPAGPQGARGPAGAAGDAATGPTTQLIDGTGKVLGTILPWSNGTVYYVWDGYAVQKYSATSVAWTDVEWLYFSTTDCTGAGFTDSPLLESTPLSALIVDPGSGQLVRRALQNAPGFPGPATTHSALKTAWSALGIARSG